MFKIGDYVAHYKEGVCEVVNIGKIDMGSSDKEYYTLKPVYDAGGTVYTPVDNKRDQIRKLITKEEAENLIKEMPKIDIIGVTNEKQREGTSLIYKKEGDTVACRRKNCHAEN